MQASKNAIELIKKHEGCRLAAYLCPGGVWTVGYGSTRGVNRFTTITKQEAEIRLREDVREAEIAVQQVKYLQPSLNQGQYDALVDFVYNFGAGKFNTSALRKKIVANPADPSIRDEFARWVHAGGVRLQGLVARRRDETDLYFT